MWAILYHHLRWSSVSLLRGVVVPSQFIESSPMLVDFLLHVNHASTTKQVPDFLLSPFVCLLVVLVWFLLTSLAFFKAALLLRLREFSSSFVQYFWMSPLMMWSHLQVRMILFDLLFCFCRWYTVSWWDLQNCASECWLLRDSTGVA